ncbi:ECF RNA polymerase sigma factor SigW [Anaerolineae bacterium]|nr:ECF RNA polymerase sigma factor SigW [Anaerolineae bacterium]
MSRELEYRLLERAREGDHEAFGDLQAELEPPIRRFVRRLIGYHDAEDDIVQTVFIALYRSMNRIDPIENLRPYVYRMARNRCYDELRSQGRFQKVSLDDEPTELWVSFTAQDQQPHSEDVAHWLLLQLEVREAMDRLPELQRQTLILYSEEEMSYVEIAEAMNTSIGTVKSRLFYAKKTLRQLLRPETVSALDMEFETKQPAESTANGNHGGTTAAEGD